MQATPDASPTSPAPRQHRVIMVQESPSHRPAAPEAPSPPPSNPAYQSPPSAHHHTSNAVPDPTLQSPPSPGPTSRASPLLGRSPVKDEDSGILDPNGYATSNGKSGHQNRNMLLPVNEWEGIILETINLCENV